MSPGAPVAPEQPTPGPPAGVIMPAERERSGAIEKLILLEWFSTILPGLLFPLAFVVLGWLFGGGVAIGILFLSTLYFMPAFVAANSLGYNTVEGHPQFPMVATSLNGYLAILLVQGALVAIAFCCCKGVLASERWAVRRFKGSRGSR